MIIEVRANNIHAFNENVALSLKADMRNKKFATNVHKENNFNVLKVAGIYGANNTGKTCLVKCIRDIKRVLLNEKVDIMENLFTSNTISQLGVTFVQNGNKYAYDFKYNTLSKEYVYEKFSEIFKDQYGNEREEVWFLKDNENLIYESEDIELSNMLSFVAQNNIMIYMIDTARFDKLEKMKKILISFASKIDVINMNDIPIKKTIELMKNKNDMQNKVVSFIKNADLYMENFEYVEMDKIKIEVENAEKKPDEKALDIPEQLMDQIRLVSTYKGVHVPSVIFDSTGTKKITALASYVIAGLQEGRILVVDELDSSIHFKLTRAIVSMFNNELNENAQLIFTVHDINLMDCKRMFRKEQIWFVHKDDSRVYLYSLADFTANDGVRDTTDIIEKYRKGALGALPDPELINTLLEIKR